MILHADAPDRVICDVCGMPMALVRTDPGPYGALFRYECCGCPARGTVERRTEESPAANAPLTKYHGKAAATEGEA